MALKSEKEVSQETMFLIEPGGGGHPSGGVGDAPGPGGCGMGQGCKSQEQEEVLGMWLS
jgi:hypothetical protein